MVIHQKSQQFYAEICKQIFESWQKKQNEVIHQKLAKQFHSANLRVNLGLKSSLLKWKHFASEWKTNNELEHLREKVQSLEKDLQMEIQEKEEYQMVQYQSQTQSEASRYSQNDDETMREDRIQTQSSFQKSKQNSQKQAPFIQSKNIMQIIKLQDYPRSHQESENNLQSQQNILLNQSGSRTEFDPLNSVTHRQTNSIQFGFGQMQGFSQATRHQNHLYHSQVGINNMAKGSKNQNNGGEGKEQRQECSHNFQEDSEQLSPQQLRILNRQNSVNQQQQMQSQKIQRNPHIGFLQLENQEYYGQRNQYLQEQFISQEVNFQEEEDATERRQIYGGTDAELLSMNTLASPSNLFNSKKYVNFGLQQEQPRGETQRYAEISEASNHHFREDELFNKGCDGESDLNEYNEEQSQMNLKKHEDIARSLSKHSQEERLKLMLEAVMQEKFQGQIPETLSPSQQRQLEHLVSFVNKINNETNECTFHPQINRNTKKILEKRSPLLNEQSKKVFSRLHQDSEIKQLSHKKYQEIKNINELVECTFSPQTNSPRQDHKSLPSDSVNRLHYQEISQRSQNLSRKEAEKMEEFRKDYTFKPERLKTKKLDNFFVKQNKENESADMFDRLYKNHQIKEQKLEIKRRQKQSEEIETTQGRSKSASKRNQLELSNISNHQQFGAVFPQSCTNQKAAAFLSSCIKDKLLYPQNPLSTQKRNMPHYSSTINFQRNLRGKQQSQDVNCLNLQQNLSRSNLGSALTQSAQSLSQNESQNRFHKLYQNALESSKRKDKLRRSIDKEIGLSFSPKMFKPAAIVGQPSPKSNVIDRNEEFLRNKMMKIQLQEEQKYSDCTFEPQLISKNKGNQTSKIAQSITYHLNKLKDTSKVSRQKQVADMSYNSDLRGSMSNNKIKSHTEISGSLFSNSTDERQAKIQGQRVQGKIQK